MAKKRNKTEDQFAQIEETLSKTEQYIEDNQKNCKISFLLSQLHSKNKALF